MSTTLGYLHRLNNSYVKIKILSNYPPKASLILLCKIINNMIDALIVLESFCFHCPSILSGIIVNFIRPQPVHITLEIPLSIKYV